ncbi:MAG: sulfite exporter TauE/SafE family protein [Pseudomonadota bacterium]
MAPDTLFLLTPATLALACAIAVLGGFVKGTVGFALPMILISGLGSVMPPDLALGALIVSAVVTNVWQAFRNGLAAALASARAHWRYLAALGLCLVTSAQLVALLSPRAMFLTLGIPVTIFAALQLIGWRPSVPESRRRPVELGVGALAGGIGGVSGVWGPPTVLYLTALNTPKDEQMRVQGVVYGAGATLLAAAHVQSGVLNAATAPLSTLLLLPSLVGLALGFALQDQIDQARFRRLTLLVLIVAGLNLIRRGLLA